MHLINENQPELQTLKAMTGVLSRLMADGDLSGRDIRVVLAVLALGGLSETQIPIRISSVSQLTNIPYKHLWMTLNRLKRRGWLLHVAGCGRGNLSTICLRIS